MNVLFVLDVITWTVVTGLMSMMAFGISIQLNTAGRIEDPTLLEEIKSGKLHKQRATVYLILMSCTIMALNIFTPPSMIDVYPYLRTLYIPCVIFMIIACIKEIVEIKKLNPLYFCYAWMTGRLLYGMIQGTV